MNDAALTQAFSAEEREVFQQRLFVLLGQQVAAYTSGESSSVPVETANALLASLSFSLQNAVESGLPVSALLHDELSDAVQQGRAVIREKSLRAKRVWMAICRHQPPVENRSMTDTLKSIRSFWSAYDVRFFAHDIPCDAIDYQLALPVAPEKQGVNFLLCYLNRLAFETDFLRRYPVQELRPVLRAYCPDYYGLLINLYEPIATNALGRCLLHLSPHSLDLTAQDLKALLCLLASLDREQLAALLREAASDVSSQLELRPRQARQYLKRYAETLIPRIVAACQKGDLSFLFLSALH